MRQQPAADLFELGIGRLALGRGQHQAVRQRVRVDALEGEAVVALGRRAPQARDEFA